MNNRQTTEHYVWPFRDLLCKLGGPLVNTLESIDRPSSVPLSKVGYGY